jgi:exosome complex component RRP42
MENKTNQLSQILNRTYNSHGLNLKALGIIPGETCWVLRMDVLGFSKLIIVLEFGGSVLDSITLAARAALLDTLIPQTTVEEIDGHFGFEIGDEEICKLEGAENIPVSITLNQLGNTTIIDATIMEEQCASSKLFVMVSSDGKLCGMQKSGNGSLSQKLLVEMSEIAKRIGQERIEGLDAFLYNETIKKQSEDYEIVGFNSI